MASSNMCPCDGEVKDFSDWMGSLDSSLHTLPLTGLAIPGSHDSCIYNLNKSGDVSPDEPAAIVNLVKVFGSLAKSIVYDWSVTQSLSIAQQLHAGVRYLDMRLAARPGSCDLFCVHGLYGPEVIKCLDDIERFLKAHPKEIVLLDFNHFYNVNGEAHEKFLDYLTERFGAIMCPAMDLSAVTLDMLWGSGLQLIVFYHCNDVISSSRFQFFTGNYIISPWPNTTDSTKLLNFLSTDLSPGRQFGRFYVSQGVLTPDTACIVGKMGHDLRGCLAKPLAGKFVEWVRRQVDVKTGINICIMDFVEMNGYIEAVIRVNSVRAQALKQAN